MVKSDAVAQFLEETAIDGICYFDAGRRESEWTSDRFWRILGYDEVDQRPANGAWQSHLLDDDIPIVENAMIRFADGTNETCEITVRFKHLLGHIVWMRVRGRAFISLEDERLKVIGVLTDVTDIKRQEQNLLVQNELYSQVVEGSDIGAWTWNIQTGETRYNERWASQLGFSLAELGKTTIATFNAIAHPEDLEISNQVFQDYVEGKSPSYTCDIRLKHRDGHWIWVQDKGKIVTRTADGRPEWVAGSHQDITNAKQIIERNKLFIDQAPSAIALLDSQLRYLVVSSRYLQDFGLVHQDIIGRSHFDVFPELPDSCKTFYYKCLKGEVFKQERYRLKRQDGRIQWLDWEMRPWHGYDGNVSGMIMFTQDVTMQYKAAEQLRISEEIFRRNFESAAIGMAILNKYGRWLLVNSALCDMLGYTEAELKHKTFMEVTHPDDLAVDHLLLLELIEGKVPFFHLEKRYIHKLGHDIHVHISVSSVRDEAGDLLYFTGQVINLNEQKKAEQSIVDLLNTTREQNDRLKNFAHIVSHNLRSHSGNFKALLDLYSFEFPERRGEDLLDNLHIASDNLQETIAHLNEVVIINDFINHSLQRLEVHECVAKAIQNVSALANEARVRISNEIKSMHYVKGVAAYMDSVLINLLSNAIKYRDERKECYVKVFVENLDHFLILAVEDNGLGIDLSLHGSKIFGMYKTFHKHEDSKGLGLFITKNQVEAMDGRITVESEPNVGSTFKIYLKHAAD